MGLVDIISDSAGLDLCHMTTPSARKSGKRGFGAVHIATSHGTVLLLVRKKQTNKNEYRLGK